MKRRWRRFRATAPISPRLLAFLVAAFVVLAPLGWWFEGRGWFDNRPLLTNYWSGLVGGCFAIPTVAYLIDGSRTRQSLANWRAAHLQAADRLAASVFDVLKAFTVFEFERFAPNAPWAEVAGESRPTSEGAIGALREFAAAHVYPDAEPSRCKGLGRGYYGQYTTGAFGVAVNEVAALLDGSPLREAVVPALRLAQRKLTDAEPAGIWNVVGYDDFELRPSNLAALFEVAGLAAVAIETLTDPY